LKKLAKTHEKRRNICLNFSFWTVCGGLESTKQKRLSKSAIARQFGAVLLNTGSKGAEYLWGTNVT
jgi:hypothetical protein